MSTILSTHEVPSESDPRRTYTVTVYETHASCSCPAWRNLKMPEKERVCKHVESITGELRKGDAKLTHAESAWVIRKLLGTTEKSFQSIADAVESELSLNSSLTEYEQVLATSVIETLRGGRRWEDDEAPGPDAQRALNLIQRALNNT